MRFNIILHPESSVYGNVLPLNYSYELSATIYSLIAKADVSYAAWLHENGFRDGSKKFRFFVFSSLHIPAYTQAYDRLTIHSDTLSFYLSFLPEIATEKFITGCFLKKKFVLGDKKSKVKFTIGRIQRLAGPVFTHSTSNLFRLISPAVVSVKREDGSIQYVSPAMPEYSKLVLNNLLEKYKIFYGKEFEGNREFNFEVKSQIKEKLITIKAFTPSETRVKACLFKFSLSAHPELLYLMYETGIGEKGSTGFGMVDSM